MTFDDQILAAYVDGELDPATRTLVEAAASADAELAARLKAQQDLKTLLTGHYGPIADEPLPGRLLETLVRGAPASAEVVDLSARRRPPASAKPKRPPLRVPAWAGMAACLVVGLAIGRIAMPPSLSVNGDAKQALVAAGPLARALERQTAADTSGPIRIGLSFRDHDGAYCRTFRPNSREGLAGLACRHADAWRLRVVSPIDAVEGTAYRTAGAETPPSVLSTVDALIEGEALDAHAEKSAIARRWRR